jgi:DNA-binding CsgD family transcriptional regulator/PAS domain-containing protein
MELTAFDELVGAIYEAGMQPEGWQQVVGRIQHHLKAESSQFWTPLTFPADGGFAFLHNMDEAPRQAYIDYYHRHDIWNFRALERGMVRDDSAFVGDQVVDAAEWRMSEFWNDFLRKQDLFRICAGIVHDGSSGKLPVVAMNCYRGIQSEPFSEEERSFLARLLPHLRRSLHFQMRLAPARKSPAELALDRLAIPVMVLAADGRVLFANAAAERLAASHASLRLRDGRLRMAEGAAQRRLEDLLRHAADGFVRLPPGSAALAVGNPAGDGLVFSFSPAVLSNGLGLSEAAAIAFIRQAKAPLSLHPNELQAIYGLTAAESALALALVRGATLDEHAASRGVSINTVRVQLKQVMAKTGAARQADLVRILLAGHAPTDG